MTTALAAFKRARWFPVLSVSVSTMLMMGPESLSAQNYLLTARDFAVLGASTVTNTGVTSIVGNIGVAPGTAITGLGTVVLTGVVHAGNAVAIQAQTDSRNAFNLFAGLASTTNLTGQDLGGKTLTPGVYAFGSSAQLTGNLVLDFLGQQNAVFVFQIGSTLTTASFSTIAVSNLGRGSGVYWQVGSSATLGNGSTFVGNVLADQSVTVTTGVNVCGRTIALRAAVTLDADRVSNNCVVSSPAGSNDGQTLGFSGGRSSVVPEPSEFALIVLPLVAVFGVMRMRTRPVSAHLW